MSTDQTAAGQGLNRELIVATALQMIDDDGAQGLSMRRLGQRLNVEAMSLYRYITGREDLLEAVIASLLEGLEDTLDETVAYHSWQGYLQAFANAMRDVAVSHPRAFPLIATRHPAAPWLRPPLRSLTLAEHLIDNLLNQGFTDSQAVEVYRNFSSFLLGQLLLEATVQGAETSPAEEPLDEGDAQIPNRDASVDLSTAPHVNRLQDLLSEDHSREEFEIGLETLTDRIERSISQ